MTTFSDLQIFLSENARLDTPLDYSDDVKILKKSSAVNSKTIPNRLVCQPMEGCDGTEDGSPGELTKRRYIRLAKGGAGIIWYEATSVLPEGRANPCQLFINKENIGNFARHVSEIKETAYKANGIEPIIIMQATHSGRYSKPNGYPEPIIAYNNPIFEKEHPIPRERIISDSELDRVGEALTEGAALAKKAGFDGVDIKCCHRYLASELLSAYERPGKYGGDIINRTRLLREAAAGAVRICGKDFIVTTRLNVYDGFPYPYGFGVKQNSTLDVDITEPIWLLRELEKCGVSLVNVTMGNPYINPHVNRPFSNGGYTPPEAPIEGVARMLNTTSELKKQINSMKLVCSGLSFLGVAAPKVAAGYIKNGGFDFAGFGRMTLAYPDFACDILKNDGLYADKLCIACSKCTELMRAGGTPGCIIRDRDFYLPIYQETLRRISK